MDAQLAANMLGLLLDGLQGSTSGFAHMLLGFDLQRGPSGGPPAPPGTLCTVRWLMCTLTWLPADLAPSSSDTGRTTPGMA